MKMGFSPSPHALVVPARGQGHVNGCILLARALAGLGFKISFIFFSSHYAKLKDQKLNIGSPDDDAGDGDGAGNITIHVIEDEILPDMAKPFITTPAMEEGLFSLILQLRDQGVPPTCLIADTFVPWTCQIATRAGIPRIDYWTSTAMAYLLITTTSQLYDHGIFPENGSHTKWKSETPLMLDHISGIPPFPSEHYPKELRFGHSFDIAKFLKEAASCAKLSESVLIHTLSELEPVALEACKVAGIPAYAIGPLLHHADKQQAGDEGDCISWLETQADSSVIYVAFGSHASISVEEVQELAFGLEASGNPFLWAIREGSYGDMELSTVLPEGFVKRTCARGMITRWAPQVEVLSHHAVGGFLSHCGWNSTLESLWAGIPILSCPRIAEQRSNAHYICSLWNVGLEMGRKEDGAIERSFVEHGVRALMLEEEGKRARAKAQEVMAIARKTCQEGGQSMANLQKFYADMKERCTNAR